MLDVNVEMYSRWLHINDDCLTLQETFFHYKNNKKKENRINTPIQWGAGDGGVKERGSSIKCVASCHLPESVLPHRSYYFIESVASCCFHFADAEFSSAGCTGNPDLNE